MRERWMGKDIRMGIRDGFPIFLGYFTTALAFGLLTRTSGFTFVPPGETG